MARALSPKRADALIRRPASESVRSIARWRHLQRVLGAYIEHYNAVGPHRALDLDTPDPASSVERVAGSRIGRRDILGGLVHEYHRAARHDRVEVFGT
jgi:hypothetical protein